MRKYAITWLFFVIVVGILAFLIKYPPIQKTQPIMIQDTMSLRHIAERNDVPLHALTPLLSPEERLNVLTTFENIHKSLRNLSIDKQNIRAAIQAERTLGVPFRNLLRYILLILWIGSAGLLLFRKKNILRIRTVWLVFTVLVFGFILGASPNPMEAIVRLHKLIKGIPGNPLVLVIAGFTIFSLLSILGSRMLCSWGCPLGALQESLYNIPVFKTFKKKHKLSFSASIAVRITVYLFFILLLFGILNINQGGPGSILYHHFNLFKLFAPYELAVFSLFLIPIFVLASLSIFRPFCHTICPFGLWAWFLEKVAIYQVKKIHPESCVDCRACEQACPTGAIQSIITEDKRFFQPDCWSCARCLDACPQGTLEFSSIRHSGLRGSAR